MKKHFLLILTIACLFLTKINAQDRWEVLLNNRTIAKGVVKEGSEVTAKRRMLKKTDKYILLYKTENSDTGWNRTFYIEDTNGELIRTIRLNRQSGGFYIRPAFINPLMQEKKTLAIYTVSLPNDPALAATVRPRRVLLAKVSWR